MNPSHHENPEYVAMLEQVGREVAAANHKHALMTDRAAVAKHFDDAQSRTNAILARGQG